MKQRWHGKVHGPESYAIVVLAFHIVSIHCVDAPNIDAGAIHASR
jgi:hypothetical protein